MLASCRKPAASGESDPAATESLLAEPGEPIIPPFAVKGELEGLLIVWFDEQGPHTAQRRSEVPEARRKLVRIASLGAQPGARLDTEHVYVADLSQPRADGSYAVTRHTRAWFDAQVEAPRAQQAVAAAGDGITLYMASWCGACRSAAAFMRSQDVPFAEKDIEKDAAANAEMQRKARAAGKNPRGVPVIDFRGEILLGFDRQRLGQLIDQYKTL
jgi:glutaredoxin